MDGKVINQRGWSGVSEGEGGQSEVGGAERIDYVVLGFGFILGETEYIGLYITFLCGGFYIQL